MTIPTTGISETTPAGSEALNQGDNRIREYKVQNREILEIDHVYPSSGQDATAGKHKKVSLIEQADLGTGASGLPILGAQTVSAKPELVYTDEDNNDVQITSAGKLRAESLGGVYPAANLAAMATLLDKIYPIGFVVTLGVSTNPGTLFGVGTWTAIAGRVIVGIDAGQTEFDTLDETGGANTVTLDSTMIPSHTHSVSFNSCNNNSGAGESGAAVEGQGANINSTISATSGSTGGGASHNNLQPYIVKYVWQRTA